MEQQVVSTLEREMEKAIAGVMDRLEKRLPFVPPDRTVHSMAKAAVAVYEAVAEAQGNHD